MNERIGTEAKINEADKENAIPHAQRSESFRHPRSPAEFIHFLHRTCGNQTVERLLRSGVLQAKLRIDKPH